MTDNVHDQAETVVHLMNYRPAAEEPPVAFRRTSEVPLYRIEKTPRNARRQGAFSIVTASGMILKRGHDLETVLRALEKKPTLVRG